MTVTSAQFKLFFQNDGKSVKRGENHYKCSRDEHCSYAKGELVSDVTFAILGCAVFLKSLKLQQLYDNLQVS